MTTIASRAGAGSLGVVKFGALQAKVELVIRFTRPSALGHLIVPIALVLIFTNVDVSDVLGGQGAVGMLAGIAGRARLHDMNWRSAICAVASCIATRSGAKST